MASCRVSHRTLSCLAQVQKLAVGQVKFINAVGIHLHLVTISGPSSLVCACLFFSFSWLHLFPVLSVYDNASLLVFVPQLYNVADIFQRRK